MKKVQLPRLPPVREVSESKQLAIFSFASARNRTEGRRWRAPAPALLPAALRLLPGGGCSHGGAPVRRCPRVRLRAARPESCAAELPYRFC